MVVWAKGLARIFGATLMGMARFVGEICTCDSKLRGVALISDKSCVIKCDKTESLKNLGESALALLVKPVIFFLLVD